MSKKPVFIHSLFRSGSTYFHSVFERSVKPKFFCYQEPLHEVSFLYKDSLDELDNFGGEPVRSQLRHPRLKQRYFENLKQTHTYWDQFASADVSYFKAFDNVDIGPLQRFLQSLINASPEQPVLQLIRSVWRAGALKSEIDGIYIHLWRNPRDQWWSYKTTTYFEAINHVLISLENIPPFLETVLAETQLGRICSGSFKDRLELAELTPRHPTDGYRVFYALWLLAQRSSISSADIDVSIDRLSSQPAYRAKTIEAFEKAGLGGLDFSDCRVPQSKFNTEEVEWFEAIETEVECAFKDAYQSSGLEDQILDRKKSSVRSTVQSSNVNSKYVLQTQALRAAHLNLERQAIVQFEDARLGKHFESRMQQNLKQLQGDLYDARLESANAEVGRLHHHIADINRLHDLEQKTLSAKLEAQRNTATLASERASELANENENLRNALTEAEASAERAIRLETEKNALLDQLSETNAEWEQRVEAASMRMQLREEELQAQAKANEIQFQNEISASENKYNRLLGKYRKERSDHRVFEVTRSEVIAKHREQIVALTENEASQKATIQSLSADLQTANINADRHITQISNTLNSVTKQNIGLEHHIHQLSGQLQLTQSHLHTIHVEIDRIRNSTTWKLTSPLRLFIAFFTGRGSFSYKSIFRPFLSFCLVLARQVPGARPILWSVASPFPRLTQKMANFAEVRPAADSRTDANKEDLSKINQLPDSIKAVLRHVAETNGHSQIRPGN